MTKYHVEGVLELTRFRRGNTGGGESGDFQVGASADDGHSRTDTFYSSNAGNLVVGSQGASGIIEIWIRYTGITISQADTITAATLTVIADGISTGTPNTKIFCNDIDTAVNPADQAAHAALTRTTAGIDWDDSGWSVESTQISPDISGPIQEVIDRGTWDENTLMLLWDNDGSSGTEIFSVYSQDGDAAKAPILHVEWST